MIQRILNTEEANYSSNLNKENLKKRIEGLFEQDALRLGGKLTSENEFTAYDKLAVIGWNMPNLHRKSAYIKGLLTPKEEGTLITLKVNPNYSLPIFAILAALSGVIITLIEFSKTEYDKYFLTFGLVLIVAGVVYYPVSTLLRNRLRNKVVKHLELKKVQ